MFAKRVHLVSLSNTLLQINLLFSEPVKV